MRNYLIIVFLAAAFVFPCVACAGAIDGSSPCLCAITKIIECDSQGDCQEILPEAVNLPTFIEVDVKEKVLREFNTPDSKTSAIKRVEMADSQLILQGAENQRVWSMMVTSETGKMSASVSGEDYGFLLFGACTVLP
ncbi:hypothetical protein [Desulfobacula sp.]|uniref:hypothetical protein n=1 Tax=Desulfobacula sp. TaxID=2593537 RepID=UPI00261050D3|nr:hypothetical protein [Desulfobacula sp.]